MVDCLLYHTNSLIINFFPHICFFSRPVLFTTFPLFLFFSRSWAHAHKSLVLLEHLLKFGNERIILSFNGSSVNGSPCTVVVNKKAQEKEKNSVTMVLQRLIYYMNEDIQAQELVVKAAIRIQNLLK